MKRAERRRRLFAVVLGRVLPAALVILTGIWTVVFVVTRRTVEEEVRLRLSTEAESVASATAVKLRTVVEAAQTLASNHLVVNGVFDTNTRDNMLPTFFRALRIPGPEGAYIGLTDYRGRVIASNQKIPESAPSPRAVEAANGREHVSLSSHGYHLAIPVRLHNGLPEGALVVEYTSERLPELFAVPSGSAAVAVVNDDGRVLASTEPAFAPVGGRPPSPEAHEWVQGRAAIPGYTHISLIVAERNDNVYAPLFSLHMVLLAALVLDLLAVVGGVLLAGRLVTKPLSKIVEQVGGIRSGKDLSMRLVETGPVELRLLAESFNGMMAELQETVVSKDYVENIFGSMTECLIVFSAKGTVSAVNPATCALFGRDEQSIIGASIAEMFREGPDAESPSIGSVPAEMVKGKAPVEKWAVTKDSRAVPVLISTAEMRGGGAEGAIVFVARDITAQKQQDAEIRKLNQELTQLLQGEREKLQALERLRATVDVLSTPVLEVWEDVLALPVIGDIDERRAAQITERLLTEVSRTRCRFVIIDVTGVESMTTSTADLLLKIVGALRLLGARCFLTGISPPVAEALVSLGVDFGVLKTLRTLKSGLRACIQDRAKG